MAKKPDKVTRERAMAASTFLCKVIAGEIVNPSLGEVNDALYLIRLWHEYPGLREES